MITIDGLFSYLGMEIKTLPISVSIILVISMLMIITQDLAEIKKNLT